MKQIKKIAWYGPSRWTVRQEAELRRLFGMDARPDYRGEVLNAEEAAMDYHMSRADDLVVIAPEVVLVQLLKNGLKPICPEMAECPASHPEREIGPVRHKYFRFLCYRRLVKLGFKTQAPTRLAGVAFPTTVLRLTQNPTTNEEVAALRQLYGEVVRYPRRYIDLRGGVIAVKRECQDAQADDLLLVGPLPLWDALCREGIHPLRVVMNGGKFVRLERVIGIEREFEEV